MVFNIDLVRAAASAPPRCWQCRRLYIRRRGQIVESKPLIGFAELTTF